jgi:hypothetical protein
MVVSYRCESLLDDGDAGTHIHPVLVETGINPGAQEAYREGLAAKSKGRKTTLVIFLFMIYLLIFCVIIRFFEFVFIL